MSEISIVPVDERDSGWENDRPRFRVYLHGSAASETPGWTATYDVTGADVLQVVDWAQTHAGDSQTFAVALVCDDRAHGGRGLVWLVGRDGNDRDPDDHVLLEAQQRMLTRRSAPLVVPLADKMPAGVQPPQ